MRELTQEQRRRLYQAYAYILSLKKRKTTPASEALEGDGAGVAEDTDEQQSSPYSTRNRPVAQESVEGLRVEGDGS